MKLTRFPQSCFLLETKDVTILIDPGKLLYEETFLEKWKKATVILVTHKHGDHIYPDVLEKLLQNASTHFYTSQEVATKYPEFDCTVVQAGETLEFGSTKVEVTRAEHGWMPRLRGGNEIHDNIGFIVDDGVRAYHTSDTICFEHDYTCDVLMIACNNHGLVTGPIETAIFAQETKAKLVLPCHDHNEVLPADREAVERELKKAKLNYKFLEIGEEIDLNKAL